METPFTQGQSMDLEVMVRELLIRKGVPTATSVVQVNDITVEGLQQLIHSVVAGAGDGHGIKLVRSIYDGVQLVIVDDQLDMRGYVDYHYCDGTVDVILVGDEAYLERLRAVIRKASIRLHHTGIL